MPDHRFSADQRNVQGLVLAHQPQNAFHQLIPAQVAQFTQRDSAAQMRVAVGITSGQLSGHSRVISIDSMGTLPVRILPQAASISRGRRLGFGTVELIGALMLGGALRAAFIFVFLTCR